MKLISSLKTGAALLVCSMTATPVMAYSDVSEEVATGKGGGFVGLGMAYGPDYEGSDDYEGRIAPFGRYNWASGRYISLGGTSGSERAGRLTFNALTNKSAWELGPVLQYRMQRDDVDNNRVDRMKDVDGAAEAGAFLGWRGNNLSLSTTLAADISDQHEGYLWYINGKYKFPINDRFNMALGAHLTWASDDYMETYFGVKGADAARSGLSRYNASSGFKDAGLNLTAFYKFNEAWGIAGLVKYTRMINDAEDSPLVNDVGDENQFGGVVAVTYSF